MKRFRLSGPVLGGLALAVSSASPPTAQAAQLLSAQRAQAAAIEVLKGDPYGKTEREVALNLQSSRLIMSGATKCAGTKVTSPVWEFHVVVPPNRNPNSGTAIDGYLLLDGRTGKLKCAGLPFLS